VVDPYRLFGPMLRRFEPELAHDLTLRALESGLGGKAGHKLRPSLAVRCIGLDFPNPVGLAAGFDKDARVPDRMLALGFGFVEVGTVTPEPQAGNPKPRIFRLPDDEAVINRLGFNNGGMEAMASRLERRPPGGGILGVNIGKNKTTEDAIADYRAAFERLAPLGDYVVVNISSPNTPGLRDLQAVESLRPLLHALVREREKTSAVARPPLLLKLAPDLAVDDAVQASMLAAGEGFDGLTISNTTIDRPATLASRHRDQAGGLSGKPLFERSTELLRSVYGATDHGLPIVGVGGVASAEQAYAKIRAGASLVQLYSALIYRGPGLIEQILAGLEVLLARDGLTSIEQAIGSDA
jgi:dihydroorotate dehydrogenase